MSPQAEQVEKVEVRMWAVSMDIDEQIQWMDAKPEALKRLIDKAKVKHVNIGLTRVYMLYLSPKERDKACQILSKKLKTIRKVESPALVDMKYLSQPDRAEL